MTVRTTGTARFTDGRLNAPTVIGSRGPLRRHLSAAITLCRSTITLVAASRPLFRTPASPRTGLALFMEADDILAGPRCSFSRRVSLVEHIFGISRSRVRHQKTLSNSRKLLFCFGFFTVCPTKLDNILQVTGVIGQWLLLLDH